MPILTVAAVKKYTAQSERREIPDTKAPGLYLMIQPSGAKSWALRFRRPDGRPAKMTLGRVDLADTETSDDPVMGGALTLRQARQLANQIDRQRARGLDVIEEHKAQRTRQSAAATERAANSFGTCAREFFAAYKTKRQTRPRRWRENASLLGLKYSPGCDPATAEPEVIKGGLADIWADKPVADIDGHDIHAVVAEARKHGTDGHARKLHAALSILFSWLLRERRVTANPCAGVYRPGPPQPRERVLSDAEIVAFWKGCESIGPPFGPLFQFMLITGCRLREASNMTRAELGDDGTWTIAGARTKNARPLSLALPKLAREIIANVPVIDGEAGYVFTTTGRNPASAFSRTKQLLDAAITKSAGHAVEFRLHDLRRTAATKLAELGVQLPVIEKILNHVSGSFGGIVGVYQKHEFSVEKAEALERWAKHLSGVIAGRASVVSLLSAKRAK